MGDAAEAIDAIRRAVDVLVRADVSPGEQNQYTRQLAMTELDLVFRLLSGGPKYQLVAATRDTVLACQRVVAAGNDRVASPLTCGRCRPGSPTPAKRRPRSTS